MVTELAPSTTTASEGQVIEGEFTNSQIAEAIKKDGHYNDWFVLCRTNNELSSIKSVLEKAGIPCDSFKRAELDAQEFAEAMARDTVKVLTIHTSKGLERKNVVVIGARLSKSGFFVFFFIDVSPLFH